MSQTNPTNGEQRTRYPVPEEWQVMGEQLLAKVQELVREGNVRRIVIKQEGRTVLDIPLTVGVVGALLAPTLAAIGAAGALLAQCSIEVVREESPADAVRRTVEEMGNE